MDFLQEFDRIMDKHSEIALATSYNDMPNVRIVNFYYNVHQKGIVYFLTFVGNPKTKEFLQNNKVSFTTIPTDNHEHVRVNSGIISKSVSSVHDLEAEFIKKLPSYESFINQHGHDLELYEIRFDDATVTLDLNQTTTMTL